MRLFPISLILSLAAGAAQADDAAMRRCRALPAEAARLACYDAIPVAGAAAASASIALPAPATPEQRFGLDQVQSAARPAALPKSIESTVEGRFTGWGPNTVFKLANGQAWRVVDGSAAELEPATHQKVRIVRNFLGTNFLEVEGSNSSAKVRRVE